MESPKFNSNRANYLYPSKGNSDQELNKSDTFTTLPINTSNNTPDYLHPKPGSRFSNKTEFTSSVQEFLKQSTEIQDEIRKLSEICQQISPKFTGSKNIEIPEKPDWEKVNQLIKSCNLTPLIIENDEANHESLTETFLEIIYEYSAQLGISEQAKNETNQLEKIVNEIQEKNKSLEQKLENLKSRKNIESEVRELEKISKTMENKFKKMKENLKEKEEIIRELRKNMGKNDKEFENTNGASGINRSKEIFEIFMGREFKERSKSDSKVIKIIDMYEKYKYKLENVSPDLNMSPDLNELQVILDELEVVSANDALVIISRLKQDAMFSADAENFIQEIYHELFLRSLTSKESARSEEILVEILSKISEIKNSLISIGEFRRDLIHTMQCKRNTTNEKIIEKAKVIGYFRKLFQIGEEENEFKIVHDIFFFVHEIKIFLQQARSIIGKESTSLSSLLEEISQCLVRVYDWKNKLLS